MTNCAPAGQRTPGNSPQPFGPFGIRVPPFTRRDTADHHLANDRVPFGQKLIDFPASSTRFSMMAADLPDSSNGDHS
jgi:hypothetical protein